MKRVSIDNLMESVKNTIEGYDISYCNDSLRKCIIKSLDAKGNLYMKFKDVPTYDIDQMKFSLNINGKSEPNYYEVRGLFRRMLRRLIDDCDVSFTQTELYTIEDITYLLSNTFAGEQLTRYIKDITNINVSPNKKTSKALATLFDYIKDENCNGNDEAIKTVNKYSALIGDALKDKAISQTVYYSININDYLTMSDGNSWRSCHGLDGDYRAGTLSYANDTVTIVAYAEDDDGKKIWRQLYMLSDEALLTSRVYGSNSETIINNSIAGFLEAMDHDDYILQSNSNYRNFFRSYDEGLHYPDYKYSYSELLIYSNQTTALNNKPYIGEEAHCFNSFEVLTVACNMNFEEPHVCTACNCIIDIDFDDVIYIDGDEYCSSCVSYCEDCEECHINDDFTYIEYSDRYVCNECLSDNYYSCHHCGDYVHVDDSTGVLNCQGDYDRYCPNCTD